MGAPILSQAARRKRHPERRAVPVRDAAYCRLDERDWETLAKEGKPAETVAAALSLTLPSTRAALDAARQRLAEREALRLTP